jgi:drug/metabolite transporter (DMT)-like permease
MPPLSSNLRGILAMTLATGSFVTNDTFMKMVATDLPPLQTLFMRGIAATLWFIPILFIIGQARQVGGALDRWTLTRNGLELTAVACFVVALSKMPIADVTAMGQVAPLFVFIGVALIYRQRIGVWRIVLIAAGFVGALMVAQPSGAGLSIYAFLAISAALWVVLRDLAGRRVPAAIPAMVVAFGCIVTVMIGAGILTLMFETWQAPLPRHYVLMAFSGFFLIFGQYFVFLAYRVGEPTTIAPFYYTFTIWAVLSGVLVFGDIPNLLAIGGMALILISGLIIVYVDGNRRAKAAEAGA